MNLYRTYTLATMPTFLHSPALIQLNTISNETLTDNGTRGKVRDNQNEFWQCQLLGQSIQHRNITILSATQLKINNLLRFLLPRWCNDWKFVYTKRKREQGHTGTVFFPVENWYKLQRNRKFTVCIWRQHIEIKPRGASDWYSDVVGAGLVPRWTAQV